MLLGLVLIAVRLLVICCLGCWLVCYGLRVCLLVGLVGGCLGWVWWLLWYLFVSGCGFGDLAVLGGFNGLLLSLFVVGVCMMISLLGLGEVLRFAVGLV